MSIWLDFEDSQGCDGRSSYAWEREAKGSKRNKSKSRSCSSVASTESGRWTLFTTSLAMSNVIWPLGWWPFSWRLSGAPRPSTPHHLSPKTKGDNPDHKSFCRGISYCKGQKQHINFLNINLLAPIQKFMLGFPPSSRVTFVEFLCSFMLLVCLDRRSRVASYPLYVGTCARSYLVSSLKNPMNVP